MAGPAVSLLSASFVPTRWSGRRSCGDAPGCRPGCCWPSWDASTRRRGHRLLAAVQPLLAADGRARLLVMGDGPEGPELEQAVRRARLRPPELRARLGTPARASVVSQFGLERMAERYENCLRMTLTGLSARGGVEELPSKLP